MYREDIPYIKEEIDESEKAKRYRWDIAFGLQAVDGLKPSEYMRELAEQHIEGKIKYQEVERKIKEYYSDNKNNNVDEKEADIVSLRIKKILESKSFILDISMLNSIHKELFTDVLTDVPVGMFRKYNFTKEEDVLYGDTVIYAPEVTISDVLYNYFLREEAAPYGEMNDYDKAMSVKDFISRVWKVHPYGEGNTRTVAVFAIKYYRTLGFEVGNEPFKNNSDYFRDALVLDNITNKEPQYLTRFVENAVLGNNHELKDIKEIKRIEKSL